MSTVQMLDRLAELRSESDALRLEWEELRDKILAPVQAQLSELDDEFTPRMNAVQETMAGVETLVRQQVLAEGETAKGSRLIAVFNKGRTSWDTKRLDGYAVAHPEIGAFRSEGAPSVSIRAI
jgi:hypothetical protein